MEELMDPWENLIARLVELVQEDPVLHDAVVGAIDAYGHAQEARADHEHALAERARR